MLDMIIGAYAYAPIERVYRSDFWMVSVTRN